MNEVRNCSVESRSRLTAKEENEVNKEENEVSKEKTEMSKEQLMCVASIDFARVGGRHDSVEPLRSDAGIVSPGSWDGLLNAAKLQAGDDPNCTGYVVKAWASDLDSDTMVGYREWTDLCQDQVDRVHNHLEQSRTRPDSADPREHGD